MAPHIAAACSSLATARHAALRTRDQAAEAYAYAHTAAGRAKLAQAEAQASLDAIDATIAALAKAGQS